MSEEMIKPNPLKAELRKDVDARLLAVTEEDRDRQSKIILDKIPTDSLLKDLISRGDAPFVPQYGKDKMKMLRVLEGDLNIMVETRWKIKQHPKDIEREDVMENGEILSGLDLLIALGAAFTREGWRSGYGGGCYDRFLAGRLARHAAEPRAFKKPYVIAAGFSQQMYSAIPVDEQDVKVDEVVTAE